MTASRLVRPRRARSVLARVLDSPALVNAVQALPGATLHRLVEEVGLEDAAELVALASPAQLETVFDEALWRGERAGEDARFDGERFGLWLEVLLEAGEAFAARTLAELSPDLVTLAVCRRALVVDLGALAEAHSCATDDDADDALEHALDARPSQEVAGYLVLARADEGFDALVAVLLALDEHDHAACARLLARATAVTGSFVAEQGGLVDAITILGAEETLEADAAGERADRRAAAGHLAPSDAAAFFRLARRAPLERPAPGAPPPRDPITRAYFRELASAPVQATARAAQRREDAAVARLSAIVEAARAKTEPAPQKSASRRIAGVAGEEASFAGDGLVTALRALALDDPAAHDARRSELSYVANLVIAGCAIGADGEPPRPLDALRIASAVTLLGARAQIEPPRSRARHVDKLLVDVLRHETAERLFRAGLFILHHEVALVTAKHVCALAERLAVREPSVQGVVALARRAVAEGEPWTLRRAVSRLFATQEGTTVALASSLLGPLPLVPASLAERGTMSPSQRLVDGRGLLASREEIARTNSLLAAALA